MVTQPSIPKELESIKGSLENNVNGSKIINNKSASKCEMNEIAINSNDTQSIHSIHSINSIHSVNSIGTSSSPDYDPTTGSRCQ